MSLPWHFLAGMPTPSISTPKESGEWHLPLRSHIITPTSPQYTLDFPQLLDLFTCFFYWVETSQGQVFNCVHTPTLFMLTCVEAFGAYQSGFSVVSGYMGGAYFSAPLQLGRVM